MRRETARAAMAAILMISAAGLRAESYAIQPTAASRMELRVAKTGIYSGKVHVFVFPEYQGKLDFDAAHPEMSKIELRIKSAAIQITDDWIGDKDKRKVLDTAKKDMLAVEKYPELMFQSAGVQKIDETHFEVTGTLKIRDMTKPSVVMVTLAPGANGELKFEGKAVVKLKDYHLDPPKILFGVVGTKNEMDFSFSVVGVPGS